MKQVGFLGALVITCVFATAASPQTPSDNTSRPAPNAWMLTPTPYLEWNKDISPSLRADRDHLWDKVSMSKGPVTAPGAGSISTEGGEDLTVDPYDIPNVPNRVILTATFTNHRCVLSASEYSLYTEMTLQVDQVFEDRSGSGHSIANGRITAIVYGGTVFLRSGERFSVHTEPHEFFLQPGHKYLLVLTYYSQGDFYGPVDNWDISDGVVRPNTGRTQYVAESHRSELSGLPVQQIGPTLDKLLYTRH